MGKEDAELLGIRRAPALQLFRRMRQAYHDGWLKKYEPEPGDEGESREVKVQKLGEKIFGEDGGADYDAGKVETADLIAFRVFDWQAEPTTDLEYLLDLVSSSFAVV